MKPLLRLLKNKNFMNLFGSQFTTQLEASIVDFSILIYVSEVYKSVFATSLVFAFEYIPALGVSLFGGLLGDLYDRRRILIITNIIRAIILLFLVVSKSQIVVLYFLVLMLAFIMFIYSTTENAALKNVVPQEDLVLANTIFSITINGTTLFGAIFASFLYGSLGGSSQGGLEKIFAIGVVLFLLAAVSSKFLPKHLNSYDGNIYSDHISAKPSPFAVFRNTTGYISETFKFITSSPVMTISLIHSTVLQAGMFAIASVTFKFAAEKLGVGTTGGSIFVIIPGTIGLTLGSIFCGNIAKKRGARFPAILGGYITALSMVTVGLLTIIFNPTQIQNGYLFFIIESLIALMGFGATFSQLPSQTVLHEYASNEQRGRIFGILNGGTFTIAGLLVLIISPIGDLLGGVSQFLIVIGLLSVIYVLIISRISAKIARADNFSW